MNEQDQIEALANLDGWTHYNQTWQSPSGSRYADRVKRLTSNSPLELIPLENILPDYLHSYDAIMSLIQKQDRPTKIAIIYRIKEMGVELIFDATPQQLCEALLQETGKWIE